MKKIVLSLTLLSFLSACTPLTREEQLALFHSRCIDYGYAQGTQEFDKCLARQESRHHQRSMRTRVNRADDLSFLEKETLRQQEIKMKEKQQSSGS
ncbi:hypothetical protein QPK87_14575 [Kamptonema cortianum]|nr:hypothetical protein [Geitlerinema splendidum]MDK3157789.1 hypothetical protein [Kamptonema cortianum]